MVRQLRFIFSPYQFWRDLLLKHHPELAGRIYGYLKQHHPSFALKVALPGGVKKGSLKGYLGRIEHLIQVGDYGQAEALACEGMERFHPVGGQGPTEDYCMLCGHYARVAELRLDWSAAVTRWRDVLSFDSAQSRVEAHRHLIYIFLKKGDIDAAESVFRDGLTAFPIARTVGSKSGLFDHPLLGKERVPNFFLSVALIHSVHRDLCARGVRLIIVTHPNLRDMKNLSRREHDILQGNKTLLDGVVETHTDLSSCDDAYVAALVSRTRVVLRDGLLLNEDVKSQYVNSIGGIRHTTNQPNRYDQTVYCVGSSRYCTCSEDQYTIPSCLQHVFNEKGFAVRVVNMSTVAARIQHQAVKIRQLETKPGDTVVLEFQHDRKTRGNLKAVTASLGILWHDFTEDFRDSRLVGEIFIDRQHINHHGNQEIARRLYDRFFSAYPLLHSPGYIWAEKILQDVDHGRFANKEAVQVDLVQDQINTAYADVPVFMDGTVGAIVMNCNPITRGHMHLIGLASQIVKHLYIFVVEEDRSVFSFGDRLEMIRRATASLPNVVVVPSGRFILSAETFPEYFEKDMKQDATIDTSQDIGIFGRYIAKKFNITIRFVGEEPTDMVTRQYNGEMKAALPRHGVQVIEIPRLESENEAISASRVRALFKEQRWDDIAQMCPPTTVDYLREMVQQGRLTL